MRVILFNLYPYRLQREAKQRKRVLVELGVAMLLGALLCLGISQEFADRAAIQQAFLSRLSATEAEMASQVARIQDMKNRVEVLKRQVNALKGVEMESALASQWVSYFDTTVPGSVSLTRLLVNEELIVLNGFTSTVSSLASWVDQMESGNRLFESVDLVSVTEQEVKSPPGATPRHVFEIRAILRRGEHATQ